MLSKSAKSEINKVPQLGLIHVRGFFNDEGSAAFLSMFTDKNELNNV